MIIILRRYKLKWVIQYKEDGNLWHWLYFDRMNKTWTFSSGCWTLISTRREAIQKLKTIFPLCYKVQSQKHYADNLIKSFSDVTFFKYKHENQTNS